MCRKAPWRSKERERHLIVSDAATHMPLWQNPSWLRDMHAHLGGFWDKPNTDSEPGFLEKTTRPFTYELNQILYDYTVKVRNRFKGLDLIDRVPDELWTEVSDCTLNFQMFKLVLEKAPKINLPTSAGSSKKHESSRKTCFCFIDYSKTFDCVDYNKLRKILREMGYQTTWPPSWEICMQVRKLQVELDMEQ